MATAANDHSDRESLTIFFMEALPESWAVGSAPSRSAFLPFPALFFFTGTKPHPCLASPLPMAGKWPHDGPVHCPESCRSPARAVPRQMEEQCGFVGRSGRGVQTCSLANTSCRDGGEEVPFPYSSWHNKSCCRWRFHSQFIIFSCLDKAARLWVLGSPPRALQQSRYAQLCKAAALEQPPWGN